MKNSYCASYDNARSLFIASKNRFSRDLLQRGLEKYSREEIKGQLNNQAGEIVDGIYAEVKSSNKKTENVEFITALQLSDFYFPYEEKDICFELRADVDPPSIKTYENLMAGLENATHIDCSVRSYDRQISFQIKRYPQEYLPHTNESLLRWLDDKVFSHYSDMRGTILSIILQPSAFVPTKFHFKELVTALKSMKTKITFDEVVMVYNDTKQYVVLHKLFPKHKRILVELDWALKRLRGEL